MSHLELLNHHYETLRRMARRAMQREKCGHTLSATALVHEAYLRLADCDIHQEPEFLSAAAESMRRVLIDYARARNTLKRGSDYHRLALHDYPDPEAPTDDQLHTINEALEKLESADPQAALFVKLRFFCGFSVKEVSQMMNLPQRTAERMWTVTRAWLGSQLQQDQR